MVCIVHCVFTTQSQVSFSHYIFDSFYPFLPSFYPPPFPVVTTILLSVCQLSFVLFIHSLLSVLYPTYEWNTAIWDNMNGSWEHHAKQNKSDRKTKSFLIGRRNHYSWGWKDTTDVLEGERGLYPSAVAELCVLYPEMFKSQMQVHVTFMGL